jgi:hypothetical protein
MAFVGLELEDVKGAFQTQVLPHPERRDDDV